MTFSFFYLIFFALYGVLNYYIGWQGWQCLSNYYQALIPYWVMLVIVGAVLFPVSRFINRFLPHNISKFFVVCGSYWLGIIYYLFLIFLGIDLLRLITGLGGLNLVDAGHFIVAPAILLILVLLMAYGTWNALHPVVRNYRINVPAQSSQLQSVHIVMVSDIHLGWVIGIDRLKQMVATINTLSPDIVLLAGDIVDEGVDLAAEQDIPVAFSRLQAKHGVYSVLGNHEYISRQADAVVKYFGQAGIRVLRNQYTLIDHGFILIGRDDSFRHSPVSSTSPSLQSIIAESKGANLPTFLLVHSPNKLEEAEQAGIDVQFSGHTHRGQIFPNNFLTGAIYETDWGYLKKKSLQVLVSCGYGTWGPPIRIGNQPEILNIVVQFDSQ